jgi:hypothetical protein
MARLGSRDTPHIPNWLMLAGRYCSAAAVRDANVVTADLLGQTDAAEFGVGLVLIR